MVEYDEIRINGNVPRFMKLIMLFIDRVGFPVLAFILMFWMAYHSLDKATIAIKENSDALTDFKITTLKFQENVVQEHKMMCEKLDRNHYGNRVSQLQQ